jgi:competence protein ComEA
MWETIREYLTFTRKERFGVLFLLLVISILFILPYFFKPSVGDPDPAAYEKMKDKIRNFESRARDSSQTAFDQERYSFQKKSEREPHPGGYISSVQKELFYFDPNTIEAGDWQRLGLPDHLIRTILHYIERGGRFRDAEDLKKMYGLHAEDYQRLLPFVRIVKERDHFVSRPSNEGKHASEFTDAIKTDSIYSARLSGVSGRSAFSYTGKKMEITDINQADLAAWSRLPGIGEKLAARIIHFREKLGGFFQVDQVGETFGLPDSTFQKIKPFLRLTNGSWIRIDVNSATKEVLESHPYIRWPLARAITEYRLQHGVYHSVDELLQIATMDSIKLEKLRPYLRISP